MSREVSLRRALTAIFMVMPKINDQLRAETVAAYLRGATTQKECCAIFEAQTGRRLSVRTLRSWVARYKESDLGDVRTRASLADALEQVRAMEACLLTLLAQLDREVADSMPVRHVDSSHEPPPPTDSSAGLVDAGPAPVMPRWVNAAALPPGIQVATNAHEPCSTNNFWD